MPKKIDSLKHKKDQRVLIPSREEAGYEAQSEAAQKKTKAVPLNPVTHRGQDPELYWLNKYGANNDQTEQTIDIRSLYRHEHIQPEKIMQRLFALKRENEQQGDMFVEELFANYRDIEELDKPQSYYKHSDKWSNRLILGDSLLTMMSLLERENMGGSVQMIYIDPPYGIKYGSNWQMRLNDRNVKDGDDSHLSGEPEVIKAFRDTWELGIHSYLSYLRERLLVAKELLTESGSCFVQISDENVHLVRCLMDEVFGSENFVSLITFKKTGGQTSNLLAPVCDYIIWYAKDINLIKEKYHQLYREMLPDTQGGAGLFYDHALLPDGSITRISKLDVIPEETRFFQYVSLTSNRPAKEHEKIPFRFKGKDYLPSENRTWSTTLEGFQKLVAANRIYAMGNSLRYIRYLDDFPANRIGNLWDDVSGSGDKVYVVQTSMEVIKRCILMTTDPGDLVLDPTCGSGTTAYVAEQWGRRWISIDTSRIALNIAKTRLSTATFSWYVLKDEQEKQPHEQWNVRNGFIYKKVPHVTLKSLANDEPPQEETLYDQPEQNRKKLRVSGPFTVETLQSLNPVAPDRLNDEAMHQDSAQTFTARIFAHLKSAGIKNGARNETAVFNQVNALAGEWLHAEGFYQAADGEHKAYFYIGPQYGSVAKAAVNKAVIEARKRGDADWLVILGFVFESDIENKEIEQRMGSFQVTKVRMHDDLMQEGLLKKDKKAASFVTIGEPDVVLRCEGDVSVVEIQGLDIYDPIRDEVKARSVADIHYWMVDDDYDGSNFMVRQLFFCGGDHDEFDKWKKGLSDLAKQSTKRRVERTLRVEIDEEAFDRLYGFRSHPIPYKKGKRIAVRVVSQFGEECTKVLTLTA